MTERIEKAIDIFLDAINEETLAKGSCCACAVGNLITHGMGGKLYKCKNKVEDTYNYLKSTVNSSSWTTLFATIGTRQSFYEQALGMSKVITNIKATDFNLTELMKIEYAFETNTQISESSYKNYSKKDIKADQIKGLEAVVKVMLEFDQCEDDVEEIFTQRAESLTFKTEACEVF